MRRRTSVFIVEAARHFQLAPIGLIIANVNYSVTSITSAALIPDHYPPFNHAGTVMRHVRLPDVKRDVSDVEMKIVTERRLKIADRTYSSSAYGGICHSPMYIRKVIIHCITPMNVIPC